MCHDKQSLKKMEENTQKEVIIDGCKVIDKGNGLSSFVQCDDGCSKKDEPIVDEPIGFFARLFNWFKTSSVKPYVKIRDLADPLWKRRDDPDDRDVGSDGKNAIEVGIKVEF